MTDPESVEREPKPEYVPSYIPPCANPQLQRHDDLCFDMPIETYDLAVEASQKAGPQGKTEERWIKVRDTGNIIVRLWPMVTLAETDSPDPDCPNLNNLQNPSPLLGDLEPEITNKLPPLLGEVRVTWRNEVGMQIGPTAWEAAVLEVRRVMVRRKLMGILPIGKPRPVARVTGYMARPEPQGSRSRTYRPRPTQG